MLLLILMPFPPDLFFLMHNMVVWVVGFQSEGYVPCNKSYVSFVNVSKSHMCILSMYQKSMFLKSMSHIVSVLKVMGSKKSFPSKTHKYSTYIFIVSCIKIDTKLWFGHSMTISGHFFHQLHKNLPQNLSSNDHFEVLKSYNIILVGKKIIPENASFQG